MLKYCLLITTIICLIFAGCGSQSTLPDNAGDNGPQKNPAAYRESMDRYVSGLAAEAKGDNAAAIIEFQDALNFYPSAGIYYSLAKNYYRINKLSQALFNAKKAVEFDSSSTEFLLLLQEIYSVAKMNDSAAIILEKLVAKDSTSEEALFRLAKSYEINKPQQAILIYKKLLKTIGSEWTVLVRVAELYERLGNLNGAIQSIEELIKLDPDNPNLEKLLVDYYVKNKSYEKAHAKIDELLLSYPDDDELIERNAQIYVQEGKWGDALTLYKKLLDNTELNLDGKIKVGIAYFYAAIKDSTILPYAKELFLKLDADTTDANIKLYLGAIASIEKNDSLAVQYFEKATDLAPWNVEAWIKLGGTYFDNHKYKDAVRVLDSAVTKFPADFTINLILGISYAQEDEHLKAKTYLSKAVSLNGTDVNALSAFGYTLNKLNETDLAIAYIQKAISLSPKNVDLMGTLGMIYDDKEMWNECDSIYTAALQLDSLNALINNNYAYSLSKRSVDLNRALSMVSLALQKDTKNSSYLDTKGWIYFKMGNYTEAKKYIEESITLGGEKAVILDHLGDIVFKLGDKNEALRIWQKAYDLDKTQNEIKNKIDRGSL